MDSTTVGQVCSMAKPLLISTAALEGKKRKEKTFILQRQKTLMRMVAMCWGRFSGVINKVCGKQRGTQSLWFTGNGWCLPQGGITTASCLKKYHKDQAKSPHHSHLEQLRGVHGKWKRLEPNQYRCNSLPLSVSCLLHYAVLFHSALPIFNPPTTLHLPPSSPSHPSPLSLWNMTLMLACWCTNSENAWSSMAP